MNPNHPSKGSYPWDLPNSEFFHPFVNDNSFLPDHAQNFKRNRNQQNKNFPTKLYTNRAPRTVQSSQPIGPSEIMQFPKPVHKPPRKHNSHQSTGFQVWPCLDSGESGKPVHIIVRSSGEQNSDLEMPPTIHSVCPTCSHLVEAAKNYCPNAQHVQGPTGVVALPVETEDDQLPIGEGEFEWDPTKNCWQMILPIFPVDIFGKIAIPTPPSKPPINPSQQVRQSFSITLKPESNSSNKSKVKSPLLRQKAKCLKTDFAKIGQAKYQWNADPQHPFSKPHIPVFRPPVQVLTNTMVARSKVSNLNLPFMRPMCSPSLLTRPMMPQASIQGIRFTRPSVPVSSTAPIVHHKENVESSPAERRVVAPPVKDLETSDSDVSDSGTVITVVSAEDMADSKEDVISIETDTKDEIESIKTIADSKDEIESIKTIADSKDENVAEIQSEDNDIEDISTEILEEMSAISLACDHLKSEAS